jgi:RNA polymerase sigma factor (sigma-70 family)
MDLESVFRDEARQVVAGLIRRGSTIDQAEDAVQEAFTVAAVVWAQDGLPPRPGAWIATTAKRRLIDRLRREARRGDKEMLSQLSAGPADFDVGEDDRLRLIFTCCHPALSLEARVALTLRAACGLTTGQVADLFVVTESTMAQRLVRAQRKIAVARIPFAIPTPDDLGPRLSAVLAVVYTVFTTGYNAVTDGDNGGSGLNEDQNRSPLCDEAIRLGRLLRLLMPREAEVASLLALLLLHHARRRARIDSNGIVLFDDQDRSRWDRNDTSEGLVLVEQAPGIGPVGQYWLQAAIAAEHMAPPSSAERNWHRIAVLHQRLVDHSQGSPMVRLNHAIAVSMAEGTEEGPLHGLVLLDGIGERLDGYSGYHAARADCLARTGRPVEASAAYDRAIETAASDRARQSLTAARGKLR